MAGLRVGGPCRRAGRTARDRPFGGRLVAANIRAETLFNLRPRDLGRPFQDLEVSYRPVELRSIIEHVTTERRRSSSRTSPGTAPRQRNPACTT